MKKLSMDTVNTVAEFLILTLGTTTTLDVKNNLRKLGFKADQAEVSDLMEKIYTARKDGEYAPYELDGNVVDLTYVNKSAAGNTFRVYSFVNPKATVAAATAAPAVKATTATAAKPANARDYISKNMHTDSATLAKKLGISAASVRAFKANINR